MNQDNVFNNQEPELDQGIFNQQDQFHEEEPKKKKSSALPVIAGVTFAVAVVGFFGWKIIGPRFMPRQPAEMIVASPVPQQMQPQPQMQAPLQVEVASAPASAAPSVQLDQQGQQPGGFVASGSANQPIPLQVTAPVPVASPAVPVAIQQPTTADLDTNAKLSKLSGRIDELEKSIASIQAMLSKSSAGQVQKVKSDDKTTAVKKATKPVQAPKPKVVKETKTPAQPVEKEVAKKPVTNSEISVKAILEGRAWFQTKHGESITAAVGDSVRGLGVIRSIDAERGEVTFTNGSVMR